MLSACTLQNGSSCSTQGVLQVWVPALGGWGLSPSGSARQGPTALRRGDLPGGELCFSPLPSGETYCAAWVV